jgi:hypothetical protein
VKLAEAERHAFELAVDGDFKTACNLLQKGIDEHCGKNEHARPNSTQNLARIKHVIDPGEALQLQKSAYQKSMAVLRPPPGTLSRPADPGKARAASRFLAWYKQFSNANGVIAEFETIRTALSFEASTKQFEKALKELAPFLGAIGVRPEEEFGAGPDNLLLWSELSFVIEVKIDAKYDKIPKKDGGQLLSSMEWFKDAYPTRTATPSFVVATTIRDDKTMLPAGARVITPATLASLVNAISNFLASVVAKGAAALSEAEINRLQVEHGLAEAQFLGRFSELAT